MKNIDRKGAYCREQQSRHDERCRCAGHSAQPTKNEERILATSAGEAIGAGC